jgi:uncharacterized protein
MANSNQEDRSANKSANPDGKKSSARGFAALDPARQREIASLGGKAAHASGRAHQFNAEEARAAGRKGGQASGANRSSNRAG